MCNNPLHVMDTIPPIQYVRTVNEADITGGRSPRMSSDYYVKLGDGSAKRIKIDRFLDKGHDR